MFTGMKKHSTVFIQRFNFAWGIAGLMIVSILLWSCGTSRSIVSYEEPAGISERPEEKEDPYFTELEPMSGEVFRVLITEDSYLVRQMSEFEHIRRVEDMAGDEEQLEHFREFSKNYNFKDWELTGVLNIKINPETKDVEHIDYVPGQSPKTWQASKYFQEDISRLRLEYLKNGEEGIQVVEEGNEEFIPSPLEFKVRYRWVIKREDGLSDEEAKARAIQFLRNQVRT
jgi:hypothetical protein